jgi:hypothetical protein
MRTHSHAQCRAVADGARCSIYPSSSLSVTLLRALLLSLALTLGMTLFLVPTAEGCPRCAVGETARSQVWNDDFAVHLAIAITPFALIGAISAGVERIGRPRARELQS